MESIHTPAVRDLFLDEIGQCPDTLLRSARALAGQVEALAQARALTADARLTVTGMGSSADAVTGLASVLGRHGVDASVVNTAELLHHRMGALRAGSTVLVVSQSGHSVEAVKMATRLGAKGDVPLVSVTNGLDNPLAEAAQVTLDIDAGEESGPSSKTYVATMFYMQVLADVLGTDEPIEAIVERNQRLAEQAAQSIREWAENAATIGQRLADWIEKIDTLMVLGRGVSLTAAELNALVLKESAHVAAQSMDSAEFRHGPLEMAGPGLGAVLVCLEPGQADLDVRLRQDLMGRGADVVAIGVEGAERPDLPLDYSFPGTAPLIDAGCAVLPLLAGAWAEAARTSQTPGVFQVGAKVTTCE